MPPEPIPSDDSILRWVRFRSLRKDADGAVIGVLFDAFKLRPEDDGALSALWVEFFQSEAGDQHQQAIAQFAKGVTFKKNDQFAKGKVSDIRDACQAYGVQVRIVHEPDGDLECHALVRRFNDTNDDLLELLAAEAWAELHVPAAFPEKKKSGTAEAPKS